MTSMMNTTLRSEPVGQANPNFWNAFRSEVYRWSRHGFYRILAAIGLIVSIAFTAVFVFTQQGTQLATTPGLIDQLPTTISRLQVDLGQSGAFAFGAEYLLLTFPSVIGLAFILVMEWNIGQEFNWRTLKMIATRQPSRTQYVLVKILLGATAIIVTGLSFVIGWLIFSVSVKLIFGAGLTLTANDTEAIGKSLRYFSLWLFTMFIWGLFTLPLLFRFKSMIGATLLYIAWTGIDASLSAIGTFFRLNEASIGQLEGVVRTLADVSIAINPYLITTNANALLQLRGRTGTGASSANITNIETPEAAFIRLVVWAVILITITITIYRSRDITE